MTDIKTITSPKKTKQLTEEVQRMKVMNEELIAKLGICFQIKYDIMHIVHCNCVFIRSEKSISEFIE